jgi:hypothetical protein
MRLYVDIKKYLHNKKKYEKIIYIYIYIYAQKIRIFHGLRPRVCPSKLDQAFWSFFSLSFFFAWHIKNIFVLRTARCFVNYGIIIIKKER